jgi:hypothetical protein
MSLEHLWVFLSGHNIIRPEDIRSKTMVPGCLRRWYPAPMQSSRGDTPALSLFCDERRESSYFELQQAG